MAAPDPATAGQERDRHRGRRRGGWVVTAGGAALVVLGPLGLVMAGTPEVSVEAGPRAGDGMPAPPADATLAQLAANPWLAAGIVRAAGPDSPDSPDSPDATARRCERIPPAADGPGGPAGWVLLAGPTPPGSPSSHGGSPAPVSSGPASRARTTELLRVTVGDLASRLPPGVLGFGIVRTGAPPCVAGLRD